MIEKPTLLLLSCGTVRRVAVAVSLSSRRAPLVFAPSRHSGSVFTLV
jgi:hypothetical protein